MKKKGSRTRMSRHKKRVRRTRQRGGGDARAYYPSPATEDETMRARIHQLEMDLRECQVELRRMGEAKVATPCIEGIAATIGQGEPGQNVMTLRELQKYGRIYDEGKTTQWIRCKGLVPANMNMATFAGTRPLPIESRNLTDYRGLTPLQTFYLSERDKLDMDVKNNSIGNWHEINRRMWETGMIDDDRQRNIIPIVPEPGTVPPWEHKYYVAIYKDIRTSGLISNEWTPAVTVPAVPQGRFKTPDDIVRSLNKKHDAHHLRGATFRTYYRTKSTPKMSELPTGMWNTSFPLQYTFIPGGVSFDALAQILPGLGGGGDLSDTWTIEIQVPCTQTEAIDSIPADTCGACGQSFIIPDSLRLAYDQERRELLEGITTPVDPYPSHTRGHDERWNEHLASILFSDEIRKRGTPANHPAILKMVDEYTTPEDQLYFRWVRIVLDE
jgi:hypothetical protein